jgi:phospholipid/cholesterol/gamma-HCH transport system permease protein
MAIDLKIKAIAIINRVVIKPSENLYSQWLRDFFEEIARLTLFAKRFIKELVKRPYEIGELLKQSFLIGYKSFPLVVITGFIMGLVLTIQARPTLVEFGAESWLPAMVAISIIREIGPVITALIFAGKVGSGIGAELASMKASEQIDAMEVSGINPFKYLVVTRILSTTLMLPVLVILADAISLYGAYVGANLKGDVSFSLFFLQNLRETFICRCLSGPTQNFLLWFCRRVDWLLQRIQCQSGN